MGFREKLVFLFPQTSVVAVVVTDLFPNRLEFNVGVVVVVFPPKRLGVVVVAT